MHDVGHKHLRMAVFRIHEVHPAQLYGDAIRLCALDLDELVRGDTQAPVHRKALFDPVARIALEARNKPGILEMNLVQPAVIIVCPIDDQNAVRLQAELSGHLDLVSFAIGNDDTAGNVAPVIK